MCGHAIRAINLSLKSSELKSRRRSSKEDWQWLIGLSFPCKEAKVGHLVNELPELAAFCTISLSFVKTSLRSSTSRCKVSMFFFASLIAFPYLIARPTTSSWIWKTAMILATSAISAIYVLSVTVCQAAPACTRGHHCKEVWIIYSELRPAAHLQIESKRSNPMETLQKSKLRDLLCLWEAWARISFTGNCTSYD